MSKLRKILTIRSITKFLFVSTQLSALLWVNWSYLLATYATVCLQQPLPMEELSGTAVTVIIGTLLCKVLENALEHNDGVIWGKSNGGAQPDASEENMPDSDTERSSK